MAVENNERRKMKLEIDQISTDDLTWWPKDRQFSGYISDVSRQGFMPQRPIWDDSCDVGFELKSAKTGKVVIFALEKIDEDEGDIHGWWFVGHPFHEFGEIKVLLIND